MRDYQRLQRDETGRYAASGVHARSQRLWQCRRNAKTGRKIRDTAQKTLLHVRQIENFAAGLKIYSGSSPDYDPGFPHCAKNPGWPRLQVIPRL